MIQTLSLSKSLAPPVTGLEILRLPDKVRQETIDWYLSDDVDQAWSGQDSNHFEVAYLKEESTEVSVNLSRADHRECMDG